MDSLSVFAPPPSARPLAETPAGAPLWVDAARPLRERRAPCSGDFARRWAAAVGGEEPLRARLASPGRADAHGEEEPDWARLVADAYRRAPIEPVPGPPVPFEPLFLPLLAEARARLADRAGDLGAVLAPGAIADTERALLDRLGAIGSRGLYGRFSVHRSLRQARSLIAALSGAAGTDAYTSFLEEMTEGGGVPKPFLDHPVLARLLGVAVGQWVEVVAELGARLAADREALAAAFGLGRAFRVTRLSLDLGDAHAGGRSVMILTVDGGTKVVYKPRPLGMERAYEALTGWLTDATDLALRAPRVLCGRGYGWVEFVEAAPCERAGQVRRFYERAGALLALAHVLNGTDFHQDNLLAVGEHPVLIDLETLSGPEFRSPGEPPPGGRPTESVLGACIVPTLLISQTSAHYIGGLVADDEHCTERAAPSWVRVNTDGMRLATVRTPVVPRPNVPVLGERRVRASDYAAEIEAGFRRAYLAIAADRGGFLDAAEAALAGQPARVIFRNTDLYHNLVVRGFRPRYLQDGRDRSLIFEELARAFSLFDDDTMWPILDEEVRAMEDLDIPLFSVDWESRDLTAGSAQIRGCFRHAAREVVVDRLAGLGPDALEAQAALIRGALAVYGDGGSRVTAAARGQTRPALAQAPEAERPPLPDPVPAARRIGEAILRRARVDGQAPYWPSPVLSARYGLFTYWPSAVDLYGGSPGVGLALAALARQAGSATMAAAARSAFGPLLAAAARWGGDAPLPEPGLAGTGGAVFALATAGDLLSEEGLQAAALDLASRATPAVDLQDGDWSMSDGLSGLLVGLVRLEDVTGGGQWADGLAHAAQEAALATEPRPQAHRNALAYALATFGRARDCDTSLTLARTLVPDAVEGGRLSPVDFTRLLLDEGAQVAAVATGPLDPSEPDSWLDGAARRLDLLCRAARAHPETLGDAQRLAREMVGRSERARGVATGWPADVEDVTLTTGEGGTLYTLLQLAPGGAGFDLPPCF